MREPLHERLSVARTRRIHDADLGLGGWWCGAARCCRGDGETVTQPFDDFLHRLGDVVSAFQSMPGSVHRRIWIELGPWVRSLTINAVPKWLAQMARPQRCHVADRAADGHAHRCERQGIVLCSFCHNATCLEHGFINRVGEAICYVCASRMATAYPRTPPHAPAAQMPVDDLGWACRVLKVAESAPLNEIKSAHRKLSRKYHPDRYQTSQSKANAERKFKDVQTAFKILEKHAEKRSAA